MTSDVELIFDLIYTTVVCMQVVMQYAGAQVVWCQEEPKNMGAWRYVKPRFDTAMRELEAQQETDASRRIRYVGRPAAASPGIIHLPFLWHMLLCTDSHTASRSKGCCKTCFCIFLL